MPIPGEIQVVAKAGSVLVQDSRLWHTGGVNVTSEARTSAVVRYAPHWLSVEFGRGQTGFGGANAALVPRDIFDAMPSPAQALYAHRVRGGPPRGECGCG
jgi:ectoine hydroxylase-related dioxygenase (phytanoyl-CoA dioxygenase family)